MRSGAKLGSWLLWRVGGAGVVAGARGEAGGSGVVAVSSAEAAMAKLKAAASAASVILVGFIVILIVTIGLVWFRSPSKTPEPGKRFNKILNRSTGLPSTGGYANLDA